jgi:protein-S-isoprenylcysteine O-methyltransferase Ste14
MARAKSSTGAAGGIVRVISVTIVSGVLLFLLAGTLAWPAAWIYMTIVTAVIAVYSAIVFTLHPDLIEERKRPPSDAKAWDKPFVAVVAGVGPLGLFVLCGLDHRFGWSPLLSAAVTSAGLAMVAAGGALSNYAVAHNRFFSALVRIQRDRGHQVIDTGPYQYVRHPGYVGSILHMFGTALALGSLWAIGLAAGVSLVLGVRTALEDRALRTELEGYEDYAAHVKYRLIPWLW